MNLSGLPPVEVYKDAGNTKAAPVKIINQEDIQDIMTNLQRLYQKSLMLAEYSLADKIDYAIAECKIALGYPEE